MAAASYTLRSRWRCTRLPEMATRWRAMFYAYAAMPDGHMRAHGDANMLMRCAPPAPRASLCRGADAAMLLFYAARFGECCRMLRYAML